MNTIRNFSLASVFACLIAMVACQKDQNPVATSNEERRGLIVMNENDIIDNMVSAAAQQADNSTLDGVAFGVGVFDFPECATVTTNLDSAVRTIKIDFGTTPCLGSDGVYRMGVVVVTWTGNLEDPGTVVTINTSNYARGTSPDEMDQLQISKTITNEGLNSSGHLQFHVLADISVVFFDGETATRHVDKQKEWVQGFDTPGSDDDMLLITGTVTGVNKNGVPFNMVITTPLERTSCEWFVRGVIEITKGDMNPETFTVDFGDGNCDNIATITGGDGRPHFITLK